MSDNVLLWVQTITLLVTGGIVAWYTWETHKIRKDAAHQNELIARQVDLMFQSLKFETVREESASEPFFKWTGGNTSYAQAINRTEKICIFRNEGGAITNLEIKTDPEIQASLSPKDRLGEEKEGKAEFHFSGTSFPTFKFQIHYTTRQNKRGKKRFVISSPHAIPQAEPTEESTT